MVAEPGLGELAAAETIAHDVTTKNSTRNRAADRRDSDGVGVVVRAPTWRGIPAQALGARKGSTSLSAPRTYATRRRDEESNHLRQYRVLKAQKCVLPLDIARQLPGNFAPRPDSRVPLPPRPETRPRALHRRHVGISDVEPASRRGLRAPSAGLPAKGGGPGGGAGSGRRPRTPFDPRWAERAASQLMDTTGLKGGRGAADHRGAPQDPDGGV